MGSGNGNRRRAHLVWDWNGTLLHDIHAVIDATNATFAELGMEPITLERYRDLYCVPVQRFYERLLGRLPTEAEWEVMDEVFHREYALRLEGVALADGAAELLGAGAAAGRTQSLCSLAPHAQLLPLVRTHGIERHFLRVDGVGGPLDVLPEGRGKGPQMAAHLRELAAAGGVDPARTVVIGDAADDALAARHAGADAVLYTGGSHSRASLAETGAPVVDSLAEAVEVAEEMAVRG